MNEAERPVTQPGDGTVVSRQQGGASHQPDGPRDVHLTEGFVPGVPAGHYDDGTVQRVEAPHHVPDADGVTWSDRPAEGVQLVDPGTGVGRLEDAQAAAFAAGKVFRADQPAPAGHVHVHDPAAYMRQQAGLPPANPETPAS